MPVLAVLMMNFSSVYIQPEMALPENYYNILSSGKADWKTAKGSVVKIYEGGNTPVVRNVPAGDLYKTDITVEKNDGVVIVFEVE